MSDQSRRRGRPRVHPVGEAGRNITLRIPNSLYDQIVTAALAADRSISREALSRLGASFNAADMRTIVREEIAAALTRHQLPADFSTPLPERGDPPVQPSDRDWLRLSLS